MAINYYTYYNLHYEGIILVIDILIGLSFVPVLKPYPGVPVNRNWENKINTVTLSLGIQKT